MIQPIQQLRIIAEPKAFYRERYGSELNKSENVAKRYIRAEDKNQFKLEYPTIEISGACFLLTHKKLLQKELRSHSPFRIIDSNQRHIPCIAHKQRSKQLIKLYQLWKSQLVFSLAKRVDNNVFNIFPGTSVLSQVMMDEMNQKRRKYGITAASAVATNEQDVKFATCAPEIGNWAGGDNVLMVLTKLDRKKGIL
ncbi:unnamed protein product [Rotaria sordida]|uniref:Uncharacterized protein n=1 Tax=Rotaria sordida TaxID=392033 RepID=A0A813YSH1_9BILA|nr:unnamed protein product [Rotaria sordida]CAF0966440.1 unnamed protein product [Rotaria sordida]CAF1100931.1 unnamed protein product [Rotaria sordida]